VDSIVNPYISFAGIFLMEELNLKTSTELIHYAIKHGIVTV